MLPSPGSCKQCCDEHWGTRVSFNSKPEAFISSHEKYLEAKFNYELKVHADDFLNYSFRNVFEAKVNSQKIKQQFRKTDHSFLVE